MSLHFDSDAERSLIGVIIKQFAPDQLDNFIALEFPYARAQLGGPLGETAQRIVSSAVREGRVSHLIRQLRRQFPADLQLRQLEQQCLPAVTTEDLANLVDAVLKGVPRGQLKQALKSASRRHAIPAAIEEESHRQELLRGLDCLSEERSELKKVLFEILPSLSRNSRLAIEQWFAPPIVDRRHITRDQGTIGTVTVRFDWDSASDSLLVAYYHPTRGRLQQERLSTTESLRSIMELLAANPVLSPECALSVGQLLYQLLFPSPKASAAVLTELFGSAEGPLRYPLRVRICTAVDALRRLPWALIASDGNRLAAHGWTTELVESETSERSVQLPVACRILMLASGVDREAIEHGTDLLEALREGHWGQTEADSFQRISSPSYVSRMVETFKPHILYLFARLSVDVTNSEPVLLIGTESVSFATLRSLLDHTSSSVLFVYLNFYSDSGNQTRLPLYSVAGSAATLTNSVSLPSSDAQDLALSWFKLLLNDGCDPAQAFAALDNRSMHFALFTAYKTWSVGAAELLPAPAVGPIGLDRAKQRSVIRDQVDTLIKNQRVKAIVAYAEPGNFIERFAEQAVSYLDEKDAARLKHFRVRFPDKRDRLNERLRSELESWLELRAGESLKHALRRAAPSGRSRTPLLWIDWGILTAAEDDISTSRDGAAALSADDVREWLDFCCELVNHCEDSLRIVNYLAFEMPTEHHGEFSEFVDNEGSRLTEISARFGYTLLEPLGKVPRHELLDFLRDSSTGRCPDPPRATRAILALTGGDYAATYKLIEEGETQGWTKLLRRIDPAPGGPRKGFSFDVPNSRSVGAARRGA